MKANRILADVEGDRRADYLFAREHLLSAKFPARNRTRKQTDSYVNNFLLTLPYLKSPQKLEKRNCFCAAFEIALFLARTLVRHNTDFFFQFNVNLEVHLAPEVGLDRGLYVEKRQKRETKIPKLFVWAFMGFKPPTRHAISEIFLKTMN